MQLKGSSLIEVIVATIIILVSFLLFSSVLNQLYNSRNIISEVQVLFSLQSINRDNDQAIEKKIKLNCPACAIQQDENRDLYIKRDNQLIIKTALPFYSDSTDIFSR